MVTALMIALALLMFRYVEEPSKNWVLRITARGSASKPA
jgi:peptidoglycan/LPS O-acetylase OafA/YrhL